MKRCLLLVIWLMGSLPLVAQQDYELFDFYFVTRSGDTLRDGIDMIDMRYTRKGQLAHIQYKDGREQFLGVGEIRAFSFMRKGGSFLWHHYPASYYQVENIMFTERPKGRAAVFYETIAACNGHTLYRDFDIDSDFWRYLLAKGLVIIQVLPDHKRNESREILMELMPDCIQKVDLELWPRWAQKHYHKIAPTKPDM